MEDNSQTPRRWDPIVKLTHWGIVAAVIGNALVTEEGSGWHIWVGYGLAALLGLRLLWGLIGPREARFGAFPPSPSRAVAHLREIGRGEGTHHASHNPLGAMMVYAIWGTLLVVIGSGIAMSGPPPANPAAVAGHEGREGGDKTEPAAVTSEAQESAEADEADEADEHERRQPMTAGPVAPARRADGESAKAENDENEAGESEGEEALTEVHEVAVNLLYLLIALHLMGVVFETRRSGRQIVGAMLPGGNRPA